jgi:hypothetical protein
MTARILPDPYTRRFTMSIGDDTIRGIFDGDTVARMTAPTTPSIYRIHPPKGQLWERLGTLGEAGVVNLPLYTPRLANAYRSVTRWPRCDDCHRRIILGSHVCLPPTASSAG